MPISATDIPSKRKKTQKLELPHGLLSKSIYKALGRSDSKANGLSLTIITYTVSNLCGVNIEDKTKMKLLRKCVAKRLKDMNLKGKVDRTVKGNGRDIESFYRLKIYGDLAK